MTKLTAGRAVRVMGAGLLLVTLAACGPDAENRSKNPAPTASATPTTVPATTEAVPDREPHTLVLNATGRGKVTSMTYTLDGRMVRRGAVSLPWRESISIPADGRPHSWTLEVEFRGGGRVDLVAIFDGRVAAQGGSAGSGGSTGSASVGGTVNG